MLNKVQWRTKIKELQLFKNTIRDLLFYINYHIDGDNRTPQIKLRTFYNIQ